MDLKGANMPDALGDQMKQYEDATRAYLDSTGYIVVRLDGRAFHTFTRGMEKPHCTELQRALDLSAMALAKEMMGTKLAYGQSDEYSFLLTSCDTPDTEAWFGGNIQKIVSIASSVFTSEFSRLYTTGRPAHFDARVFTLPSLTEVINYFIWRQQDCIRNSILALGQVHFSHKQMQGKKTPQVLEMLNAIGVQWENTPVHVQRGRVVHKMHRDKSVSYIHKKTGVQHTTDVQESFWGVDLTPPRFALHRDYFSMLSEVFAGEAV